ncbi:MAG: glycosyltransferase, partial [Chloroflexota bacterium]
MKILQQFDFFSPQGGGTADLIYRLSGALAQRGHEVVVYTSDYKLEQKYIDSLNKVQVFTFHDWLKIPGICLTPRLAVEAGKNPKGFDVVHLHWHRSFQAIMLHRYAKRCGIPYLVDDHGTPRSSIATKGVKRFLWWLFDKTFGPTILKDAKRVIAETEVGVKEYEELGVT